MSKVLTQLLRTQGVYPCSPKAKSERDGASVELELMLPSSHRELLSKANGILAYGGYFRVFGLGCNQCLDLRTWNESDCWKFSWDRDLSTFFCFGETGWGDQYAYKMGDRDQKIYFLDAFRMQPEVIAENFDAFLEKEFLRCAVEPYDDLIPTARRTLGQLKWENHITFAPSPLLGGEQRIDQVSMLNARASMIISGDIATQCRSELQSRKVESIEPYVDNLGRSRLRVIWAK